MTGAIYTKEFPKFWAHGQDFGPYTVTLEVRDGEVYGHQFYLKGHGDAIKSQYGNLHPHSEQHEGAHGYGQRWWPSHLQHTHLNVCIRNGHSIDEIMHLALSLGRNIRLQDGDAYCRVENWVKGTEWYCDLCDTMHLEGEFPCKPTSTTPSLDQLAAINDGEITFDHDGKLIDGQLRARVHAEIEAENAAKPKPKVVIQCPKCLSHDPIYLIVPSRQEQELRIWTDEITGCEVPVGKVEYHDYDKHYLACGECDSQWDVPDKANLNFG